MGFAVEIYGGTYTFEAGSSAPGTSNPAGDTVDEPALEPDDEEANPPKPDPKPEPEPDPDPEPHPGAGAYEEAGPKALGQARP